MGNITGRFILPHPPIAVPEIGGDQAKKLIQTLDGFTAVGRRIAALKPGTILILTPHGPDFTDHFYVPDTRRVSGDLAAFGAKKILLGFDNDTALGKKLAQDAAAEHLSLGPVDHKTMKHYGLTYDLDHGVIVPLYFINHFYHDYRLLPIATAGLSGKECYRLGTVIRRCVEKTNGDVVVIASGNLSHRLRDNGAYRYDDAGAVFDEKIQALLKNGDGYGLLDFDPKLKEKASQCCFNAILTLAGTADQNEFSTEILSYEGPFGIGYLSGEIKLAKEKESALTEYLSDAAKCNGARIAKETPPQRLARTALREYLVNGKEAGVPDWVDTGLCRRKGGVFVSIKKDGQLRGCLGSTKATQPNLAAEIMAQAMAAGTKDPHFAPVQREEMDELDFAVDLLSAPEEITDRSLLDPQKYGVIVENHGRSGVLLPDLDGIDSVEEQLRIAREKAGIHPWRTIKIKRFSVIRYES